MSSVRQASFAGGELDSLLYGRTDHPRYASGLRKCSNFLVAPQGALKNRAGTKYVASVKDPTVSPILQEFLWPSQNYVLEFGNLYVRFHSLGSQVLNGGVPLELATPFTTAMLPYLKFAQKDATLTICYGGQEPGGTAPVVQQELKRIAHTNWTLTAFSVAVTPYVFTTPPAIVAPAPVPDASHQGSQWDWRITQLWRENATGKVIEAFTAGGGILSQTALYNAGTTYAAGDVTLASDGSGNAIIYTSLLAGNLGNTPLTSPTKWMAGVYFASDRTLKITWVDGALAGYTLVGHNVYQGRPRSPTLSDGPTSFGLVGFAEGAASQFLLDGTSPDYTQQPPQGTSPFTTPANDYPAVVSYFQQRRVFARRPQGLARINASKTGQPSNFDASIVSQETDALDFTLATQAIEEIRSLVSLKALIALTGTGGVVVRGGQSSTRGVAISPSSVDATKQSQRGASWVDPVVVDNVIVFIQAKGSSIRALAYDPIWETLGNPGNDLAVVAQHFLRARTAVDMAYQEAPDSVIWIVRDDGLLLGLTFVTSNNPDQQVYAWHQHSTDGSFERVCCVPEGTEDAAYFVVKRTVNGQTVRYIERLQSRVVTDVRLGVFLDAALTFDGRNTGASTMKFTSDSGTYAGGEEGTILASVASFTANDVGSAIVFVPDGIPAVLDSTGKVVTPAVVPVRCTIIGFTDTTHVRVVLDAPLTAAFQNVSTTSWGFARRRFSGLGHLESKTLTALGDGAVATAAKQDSSLVVTGGQITIDEPAVIVHAGLGYTSEMELLDVASDQARTAQKAQYKVVVEVVETRGLWIAESGGKFWEKRPREVSDSWGNPQLATRQEEVAVSATWNVGARAVVQARDPLPVTLVAATRELVLGGK